MDLVRYSQGINGRFLVLDGDQWIKYGIEHVDLLGSDLSKFNRLLGLAKACRPDLRHVIDGGCNMGSWTIPLAGQHGDLEFHTFEVQRMIYWICCANLALHGALNVYPRWCGLGAVSGEISMQVPDYQQVGNYGAFEVQAPFRNSDCALALTDRVDRVPVVTIDSLELDPLFIKLDVEGMEWQVLKGSINTIHRCSPVVWCESHKSDPDRVLPFFESRYYTMSTVIEGHWLFIPKWLQGNPELEQILNG